jgi:hypothetical protein
VTPAAAPSYIPAGTYYPISNGPNAPNGPWPFSATKPSTGNCVEWNDQPCGDAKVYCRAVVVDSSGTTVQTGPWAASSDIPYNGQFHVWQMRSLSVSSAGLTVGPTDRWGIEVRPSTGLNTNAGGTAFGGNGDRRILWDTPGMRPQSDTVTAYLVCEYSDYWGEEDLWVGVAIGWSSSIASRHPDLTRIVVS